MSQQNVLKEDAIIRVYNNDGTPLSPCTIKLTETCLPSMCGIVGWRGYPITCEQV